FFVVVLLVAPGKARSFILIHRPRRTFDICLRQGGTAEESLGASSHPIRHPVLPHKIRRLEQTSARQAAQLVPRERAHLPLVFGVVPHFRHDVPPGRASRSAAFRLLFVSLPRPNCKKSVRHEDPSLALRADGAPGW